MPLLFLLLIFICLPGEASTQSKEEVNRITANLPVSSPAIYLFCRGTRSKSGFIARNFNLTDSNITHIGLGYYDQSSFRIFNVSDTKLALDALVIDSVSSFIRAADVFYFSIWKCETSRAELTAMKSILETYAAKQIIFDFSFRLHEDDTLYCSEFCVAVLNELNPRTFSFVPVIKKIDDPFYRAVLKRKVLIYYPVDFFQSIKKFRMVKEFRIEQ